MNQHKTIMSLQRGLNILGYIGAHPSGSNLRDIAGHLGCSSASAYHLVRTLEAEGFLQRVEKPLRYLLGPAVSRLALQRGRRDLEDDLRQTMQELHKALPGSDIYYAQAHGLEIQVTRQATDRTPGGYATGMSSTMPPYISLTSLIHLAYWPQSRREAYEQAYPFAIYGLALWESRQRWEDALRQTREEGYVFFPYRNESCLRIGFPYCDGDGRFVGTLTIQSPELPDDAREDYRAKMIAAVRRYSAPEVPASGGDA